MMIGIDKYGPQTAMQLVPRADWLKFADVEEQALALAGWNQNYLQLSAGAFQGQICQLEGSGIKLFIEHVQQSMLQTGVLPDDVLALGIPLETSGNSMFSGQTCSASDLHVFSGASGFEFRPSQRHTILGIEIQMGKGWIHTNPGAFSQCSFPAQSCALHMESSVILALKNYLLTLFQTAHDQPSLLTNRAIVVNIADQILDRIAPVTQTATAVSATCSHWQMVQHACSLVNEASDQALTVAQLCQSLQVSRRTLQTGFQQVLNISPLAYVKAYRLAQARKALKAINSVTEAATSCGFWHFGHFSHDYFCMFGEHPSDTLRRHQRR